MRHITLFVSLSIAFAATAQPVLQYGNVNLMGTSYVLNVVTDPGTSNPDIDGANATWDFSSATTTVGGIASFISPVGTPYAASYPTANLAMAVTSPEGTGYTYYNLSSAQLDMLAEHVGTDDAVVYTEPKTILEFPFAMNDWFLDEYEYDGTSYSVSRAYMGYGTVLLPGGTSATNVVKTASTSGSIAFFRSNPVAPLVSIEDDGSAVWWSALGVGVSERNHGTLQAWPNPTTDVIHVRTLPGEAWSLVDLQGRSLLSGQANGTQSTITLTGVNNGHYILRVVGPSGIRTLPILMQ